MMRRRQGRYIHIPSRSDWQDRRAFAATPPDTAAVAVAAPAELNHILAQTHERASGLTTQPVPRRPRVFASLDGLRGLAILLVVWCHTDFFVSRTVPVWPLEHLLGGAAATGVEFFFVLSGFLLFLPYARAIIRGDSWPSLSRYYVRRALRILPGYYLLIPVFLLYVRFYPDGAAERLLGPLQALLGLTLLYDFERNAYNLLTSFDGPLWTLTIEWQFYLLLPWFAYVLAWLVSLLRRRTPQRNVWLGGLFAGLGSLIALGVASRALGASAHYTWGYPSAAQTHVWLSMLLTAVYGTRGKYLEVFALGMLASTIYVAGIEQKGLPRRLRIPLGWSLCGVSVFGLAACIPWALQSGRLYGWVGWSYNFPPASAWLWSVLGDDAFGLCYACLLLGTLLIPIATKVFSWKPLHFFGKISFSLYLWHMVGLALFFQTARGAFDVVSVTLLLSFIVLWSTTAYFLIERPFLRLQRTFRSE